MRRDYSGIVNRLETKCFRVCLHKIHDPSWPDLFRLPSTAWAATLRGPLSRPPQGDGSNGVHPPLIASARRTGIIRAMEEQVIPSDRESHETLRGGERVLVRRARPDDVAAYRDFVRHVDAEDLRLRFFAHIAELTDAEADKLTHLDYAHDMAFVALDEGSGEMLGLVRLRDELDEETAEYAILVRSRLKGHGLGYLLMQRVIQYAKDKNLRRVYGDVLVENTMMLQMASELGFHIEDIGSGLKRVVLNWRPASGAAARS